MPRRKRRRRLAEDSDRPANRLSDTPTATQQKPTPAAQHWLLDVQAQRGNSYVQRMVAVADFPLLRYGATGQWVEQLQTALNQFGQSLSVDGIFGPKTHAATLNFQAEQGLGVDGIVGPQTWGALQSAIPAKTDDHHTLVEDEPPDTTKTIDNKGDDKAPPKPVVSSARALAILLQYLYSGNADVEPSEILHWLALAVGIPDALTPPTIEVVPDNPYQTLLNALTQLSQVAPQISDPQLLKAVQARIAAISDFISRRMAAEMTGQEETLSPERKAIITLALSQIGKVVERQKAADEEDPKTGKKRPTRYGWETLDEYFEVAYGGRDSSRYNDRLQEEVRFADIPLSQDWCGIFVQWVMKSNGVPLKDWRHGYSAQLINMQRVHGPPVPGDILNKPDPNNHFAIVVEVNGDTVKSIDGNIGGVIKVEVRSIKGHGLRFADIDKA